MDYWPKVEMVGVFFFKKGRVLRPPNPNAQYRLDSRVRRARMIHHFLFDAGNRQRITILPTIPSIPTFLYRTYNLIIQ
jgi:hypothetical protein